MVNLHFQIRFHRDLDRWEQFEFVNLWYVLICVNDFLIIIGSIIKMGLESQVSFFYLWDTLRFLFVYYLWVSNGGFSGGWDVWCLKNCSIIHTFIKKFTTCGDIKCEILKGPQLSKIKITIKLSGNFQIYFHLHKKIIKIKNIK